eukprot:1094589-Pelagomonas_calceolata.AAC.1
MHNTQIPPQNHGHHSGSTPGKILRGNNKCKIALNRPAALIKLPSTEELNTEGIPKVLAHKNTGANVPTVHRRINNTHISGLIDTQPNEEFNPS